MSASNIFAVKDNIIYSPPDSGKILNGITRATLFQLADSHNMKYQKQHFNIEFLLNADEVFITSTTKEVVPVCQIDQTFFKNVPGPITLQLMKLFVEHVEKELNVKHPKREILQKLFK
jgi:D-alanine transaminase